MAFSFSKFLAAVRPGGEVTATHQTAATKGASLKGIATDLDALCARYQARYERRPLEDGRVQLTLFFPSGDTISHAAATTAEAFRGVQVKIEECPWALGVTA